MKKILAKLLMFSLLSSVQASVHQPLWYEGPAAKSPSKYKPPKYRSWMKEYLPLGNGSLGCTVSGGLNKEHIQFNEDTLWVGSEGDTGSYQAFGDLYLDLRHDEAEKYRRELDISRAVHTTSYTYRDVSYKREYFASRPAQVMVFRYTADKKASLTGKIKLVDAHKAKSTVDGNRIIAAGDLRDFQMYKKNVWKNPIVLDFESQVLVLNEGGELGVDGDAITFSACDSLTVLVAAGTNYLNQRDQGWKREHPHKRLTANLDAAAKRTYSALLSEHVADYQSLFERCEIDIGATDEKYLELPTNKRLANYKEGRPDPDLEEMLFQYARYLMISCSRSGCLPSNLQGLWNMRITPSWRCDYHSDVNTQMHYWFVDQANLSDCFSPLSEWFYSIREVRREETQKHFNKRGIAMHAENGVFGGSTWKWSIGDASWIANNLWDHYRFTLDQEYLETRAYPIMKDLFMFWEDHLKEINHPKGDGKVLVGPDGYSPEHGPHEDGVSFDQQLAWDLLNSFAEASEVLGVDKQERKKAVEMRDALLGPQIGSWGQLQEWMIDRDKPNDGHRHLSHMIAVHPGRQISPITSPKFAEAAKLSMNARGDDGTGWSKAWKINVWARLHDGDRAYKLLGEFLKGNVYPNLWGFHPPFQIDGNFGYASGLCEMLMQSHMGVVHLLPALPAAWPEGKVTGMKARGGFVVDMEWKAGKLTDVKVKSLKGAQLKLRYGDQVIDVKLKKGQTKALEI